LNTEQICRILEECARVGVSFLKISSHGLEVSFKHVEQSEVFKQPPATSKPQATLTPDSGEPEELEERPQDPKELDAQAALEELQITDPLEFEERLARGELVDAGQEVKEDD
jgi:hypothetical protein